MKSLDEVNAWLNLCEQINKIQDYKLRIAMREDMRRRALAAWGWVPGEKPRFNTEPELDEWEKEFLMDVRDAIEFGVDPHPERREKALQIAAATKVAMLDWIRIGHSLYEIPEEIRQPPIVALYNECEKYLRDELWAQVENVTKKVEQ